MWLALPCHFRVALTLFRRCPGGVTTFDDVLEKIRAANAYVNVHTNDGVAPPNTAPGDFQGGEIRGQLP
jgi:hypothetical protein